MDQRRFHHEIEISQCTLDFKFHVGWQCNNGLWPRLRLVVSSARGTLDNSNGYVFPDFVTACTANTHFINDVLVFLLSIMMCSGDLMLNGGYLPPSTVAQCSPRSGLLSDVAWADLVSDSWHARCMPCWQYVPSTSGLLVSDRGKWPVWKLRVLSFVLVTMWCYSILWMYRQFDGPMWLLVGYVRWVGRRAKVRISVVG